MKTSRVVLLLSSLVLVAACGTKGPLVMADGTEPKTEPTPVVLPGSADAARDDGDAGEPADAAKPSEPPAEE
jgi:predicted small lipoprotein YifL